MDKQQAQALNLGRFATFAFCRADILFQVGTDMTIKYCSGPTQHFFDQTEQELVGQNILDLIHPDDQQVVRDLFDIGKETTRSRIEDLHVRALTRPGMRQDIALAGYRVPDFDDDFFLAMKSGPKPVTALGDRPGDRDETTGMLSNKAFAYVAADRVKSFEASGGKPKMSMVNIGDLGSAGIVEGSEEEGEVLRAIGEVLNAQSLGGDTAGRINDENFSVVHGDDVDATELSDQISNALSKAAPAVNLMPKIATMDASSSGMDEKQLAKAMMFSLQEFTKHDGEMPDGDLATALQEGLERNVQAVERFRNICDNGSFDLVYMPVCSFEDGSVHHYEALTRFREEAGESPFQLITLAEEVGVIQEFDIAVANRAVETIGRVHDGGGECTPVAINVSGHSISDADFVDKLKVLLQEHSGIEEFLSLEITESAEIDDLQGVNSAIQAFRDIGFKVALDDFGAGAASFDYLNSFDVDTVKFDGPVVKRAVVTQKGKAFLASMATLCKEIGVETIAEMVEDQELAEFLKTCGIELGQGWHFGKPMPESDAFPGIAPAAPPPPPPPSPAKKKDDSGMSLLERLSAGET